jgi:hypothetical protein
MKLTDTQIDQCLASRERKLLAEIAEAKTQDECDDGMDGLACVQAIMALRAFQASCKPADMDCDICGNTREFEGKPCVCLPF